MFKIIGADQQQYGPVSAEQIRQWIAEGRANAQTLALAEGSTEWKSLGSLPEFAEALARLAPTPPPPAPAAGPAPLPAATAATLGQPQAPSYPAPVVPVTVPNYLVPAILVTLCCCWPLPLGIVAIVYAAQVNSKLNAGDIAGAMAASRNARLWILIALVVGILGSFLTPMIFRLPNWRFQF
jgi:hypothetical protein